MDQIDARKLFRDAIKALRGQAMRLHQEFGLPWHEIARVMGLNTSTVFGWVQRYATEGGGGPGFQETWSILHVGPYLDAAAGMGAAHDTDLSSSPSTRCLPFVLWSRHAVRNLIEVEFGIDMPIRTVGEQLKRWGYTPQRTTRQVLEQKPWDI